MFIPDRPFRIWWDLLVSLAALFAAVMAPLQLVFETDAAVLGFLYARVVPALFVADIGVRLNTAVFRSARLVTDRKSVARSYLAGTFWIDAVAALPLQAVVGAVAGAAAPQLVHLADLNRLVKYLRVRETVYRLIGSRTNPAIGRLTMLGFWVLFATHLIACGWLVAAESPKGLAPFERYVWAVYWTITTLTTVGYGDITPAGTDQRIFVIVVEMFGAALYGLIIANVASLVASLDIAKSRFRERVDRVNSFLSYRRVPGSLREKVNNYYAYLWDSSRGYDESESLADLPQPLRTEISLYLNRELIDKVPLFRGASDGLLRELVLSLRPLVFLPESYIVRRGEIGTEMYFISRGSVAVLAQDEQSEIVTLSDGQFFGELALLFSTDRSASVVAKEYCDIYSLHKRTFDRIIANYPDFAATIEREADRRRSE